MFASRCLLAASSPVLASILSSTGALVELQDPCLPDCVVAALLDYIYTGTLQRIHNQEQYDRLLTAARHLQMKELQEALEAAWEQFKVNAGGDLSAPQSTGIQSQKGNDDPYRIPLKAFSNLPPSHSIDALGGLEETNMQCSSRVGKFREAQICSASLDCSIKDGGMGISKNDSNDRSITEPKTLSDENNCCIFKCTDSVNGNDYRQRTCLSWQGLKFTTASNPEERDICGGNKEYDEDHFPSAGFVKPAACQRSTEEALLRTCEDTMTSSSFSSSLPHACCGAVPVICHSSRASALHLTEKSEVSALFGSSRSSVSYSDSTDSDKTVEDINSKQKDHHGAQDQEPRHNKKNPHSEFYQDGNTSEQKDRGLSHNTDHNDQHTHCDLLQTNTKHHGEDLFQQDKNWRNGLKHKTENGFDDFPAKYQRLDCFECLGVSSETIAEEESRDWRAGPPLPIMDTTTGNDSNCEDLCPEMEAKDEHNNFGRCLTEKNTQDSHCQLYGPESNWYSNMYRAEKIRENAFSPGHEYDPHSRLKAIKQKGHNMDLHLPVSTTSESGLGNVTGSLVAFECCKSLESNKTSGAVIKDQWLTPMMSVDDKMPDTETSTAGQSYHGYLPCVPQEDTHSSHRGTDHKYSQPDYSHHSDGSSDSDEAGTFTISGQRPSKQHFVTEATDQVLSLDANTKPAVVVEHLNHRSAAKETMAETLIRNHDTPQLSKASSAACREMEKKRKQNSFEAESFDETNEQKDFEEKQPVGKDHNIPKTQVILKVGDVEVSNSNEDEKKIVTWPVCSAASVQASMPSTLSVCISSTLSVCMPTDRSAHVSCHQPFQCSLCDRSFSQRGSLNRHVRSHLGVRPFPCPCCPMTFSRQYRVTEHMRVHQRCALGNDFQKPSESSIKDNRQGP